VEAIILAGGFGTRLQPVINDIPKPMAPVLGRPFLDIALTHLSQKGFKKIILSTGYLSEKISAYFGSEFKGMSIKYVVDEQPLGTGGAIKEALRFTEDDHTYVMNGDTFLDLDFEEVERVWGLEKSSIILGKYLDDTSRYGVIEIDDSGYIRFKEKTKNNPGIINVGCYVFSKSILNDFPKKNSFSIEKDFFETMKAGSVKLLLTKNFFIDIGIPEDYKNSQKLLLPFI
jgi:D-glycero-alpha-D-manno-heptose 1-phosphate guanylyltransferase